MQNIPTIFDKNRLLTTKARTGLTCPRFFDLKLTGANPIALLPHSTAITHARTREPSPCASVDGFEAVKKLRIKS